VGPKRFIGGQGKNFGGAELGEPKKVTKRRIDSDGRLARGLQEGHGGVRGERAHGAKQGKGREG